MEVLRTCDRMVVAMQRPRIGSIVTAVVVVVLHLSDGRRRGVCRLLRNRSQLDADNDAACPNPDLLFRNNSGFVDVAPTTIPKCDASLCFFSFY